MLFLLFELGQDRYALRADCIVEVLPLVAVRKIPQAPAGVAGVFNYCGAPVPVIDLSELVLGRRARIRLSTRIVLVHYADEGEKPHLLGLIAENATETLRRELSDFSESGITNDEAPYLGPVTSDARGLIQWIEVNSLLSASVRELLFTQPVPG
jgi:chemotaxis-related protein WspB